MLQKKHSIPLRTANKKSFPIVAIGASAGGLEAISVLLKNLPSNTGMAFIYVQHLSPDHKSFLTSILSKQNESSGNRRYGTNCTKHGLHYSPQQGN